MKRVLSIVLALFVLASLTVPAAALSGSSCFEDVPSDDFYYTAVRRAYEQGLMEGTSASAFSPNASITRGVFLIGLGRVAGINPDDYAGDTGFLDVPAGFACAPYVLWASGQGVTSGIGGGNFGPDLILTMDQMMTLVTRFLAGTNLSGTPFETSTELAILASASASTEAKLSMLQQYAVLYDGGALPGADDPVLRSEAAAVFVWLNELLWSDNIPVVNDWTEFVPLSVDAVPAVENPVVSAESIVAVAEENGFVVASTAFQALCAINDYADRLSDEDRASALVFLFEGAGANGNPGARMNAMCVVVWDGRIIYLNRNSSTIPDDPFDPKKNDGTPMPTLCSGIYTYESTNQGYYAALNVTGAQVIRFRSRWDFYQSTSIGINIHRRNSNDIAPISAYWGNSVGCCLIGVAGTDAYGEYAQFIQAVGLVSAGSSGNASYQHYVTGKVIVDRSFGTDYLHNVGYSDEALAMIG